MSLLERLIGKARSPDPGILDAGLALALTVWALTEPGTLSHPGRAIVLVAMTAVIAWVRTAPLPVLALEVVGVALATNSLQWPQGVAVLISAYSAARPLASALAATDGLNARPASLLANSRCVAKRRSRPAFVLVQACDPGTAA